MTTPHDRPESPPPTAAWRVRKAVAVGVLVALALALGIALWWAWAFVRDGGVELSGPLEDSVDTATWADSVAEPAAVPAGSGLLVTTGDDWFISYTGTACDRGVRVHVSTRLVVVSSLRDGDPLCDPVLRGHRVELTWEDGASRPASDARLYVQDAFGEGSAGASRVG